MLKFGGWSNDGQTLALEQIPVNIQDKPERRVDHTGTEFLYLEQGLGLSFYHEYGLDSFQACKIPKGTLRFTREGIS